MTSKKTSKEYDINALQILCDEIKEKLRESELFVPFFIDLCSALWYYIYHTVIIVIYADRFG